MAGDLLDEVETPTLLIVGSEDTTVLEFNEQAMEILRSEKELVVIPGATHLFEEPGKLDEVAGYAKSWFLKYLVSNEQKEIEKAQL